MSDDLVLGTIETQMALLMRLGEATRRSTGGPAHRALDRAAYVILRQLEKDGPLNVSVPAAALNLDGPTVSRQAAAPGKNRRTGRPRARRGGGGPGVAATPFGLRQVEAVRQPRRAVYGAVLKDYSDVEK